MSEADKTRDEKAAEWVGLACKQVFAIHEKLGLPYDEDGLCELMNDCFIAGYNACRELK